MSDNSISSNNDNDNDDHALPLPTFSGNHMPLNICVMDDEDIGGGEETTRRVGGFSVPSAVAFDYSIAPPSLVPPSLFGSSTMETTLPKAAPSAVSSLSGGWKLEQAPILPEFHPLERNAVFIPHSEARVVAQRISTILMERSIQSTFENNEAGCLTMNNVEFSVFLYRGKKQYGHGIICEVQRLYGNSTTFHDDTQAILNAAQGIATEEPPKKKLKSLIEDDEDDYDASSSSLNFCSKLLSAGPDSQLLALSTLASMTDSSKMGLATAKATSHALAMPGNAVAAMVVQLLQDNATTSSLEMQAMMVISNVTQHASLPRGVVKALVLPRLVECNANTQQLAYLATKCLQEADIDAQVADALYQAKKTSRDTHTGLYTTVSRLLLL
jgi:hypothetical protein